MNLRNTPLRLIVLGCLISTATVCPGSTFTWTDGANDSYLQNTNNWSPVTAGRPAAGQNDTMQWNGTVAGNLVITNGGPNAGNFDANPGLFVILTAAQTGNVTIIESNGYTGRIRMAITNGLNVASGAGALTFGNGGTVALPIAFAANSSGNGGVTASWTNNSASPVTFNSDVYYVMGGGNNHTWIMAGTGNWVLNSRFQSQNSGSSLSPVIAGPGTVILGAASAPGIAYSGNYGNLTVNGGTLQLTDPNAVGSGNRLVMNGGNLDSSVANLVNVNNNPQTWSGNFGFVGTQSMDLGLGPVTNTASRIITVSASTLTVGGGIAGPGPITKDGAGTLVLNGFDTYTSGTVVSNGILQLGGSAFPSGSSTNEGAGIFGNGKLDLNGNSITVSALYGTGFVDTIAGGAPTLTVGDFDANSAFSGTIRNSSGSLALMKVGAGTLTLSGANTYSGGTTVSSGTLIITNASGSGTGSGAVTVNPGATFGGSGSVGGSVTWQSGAGGLFVTTNLGGAPFAISGSVTLDNNSVIVNVPGVVPLAAGTYTLATYNNAGSSGAFASSGVVYTGAGASPGTVSSVSTGGGAVTLTVTSVINGIHATWTNNSSGNWSVAGNWDSNPNVPHAAGDLATLGAGASYTTVTLDANETVGGVVFTNANSFKIADAGNTLTFDNSGNGTILSVAGGTSNVIASPVALNDNLSVALYPATALSVTNVVSNAATPETLAISGGGTVTLSANNTYGPASGTIGTILSQGAAVQLGNNNALGASDVLVTNGAETVRAVTGLTVANNFSIQSSLGLDNNGNSVTLTGNLSGNGSFGKNGQGTLVLSGVNTYTNTTSMSAGTIQLGSVTGIPGGPGNGNFNMGSNTVFDLNGFSPVLNGINSSFNSATIDSTTGGAVTLTLGESGAFATYQGAIKNSSGSLSLVKDGAGTQTVAGTNTFTGGTTVNGGALQVGNGTTNSSGVGIAVGLGTGAVVVNSTAALQFNLVGTNTFTNAISGTGQLNLNNTNLTLVLNTSNSFSGNVNVNAGSLWIKNAHGMGAGTGGLGSKSINVANGTAGNSQIHLDGSQGNLTLDDTLALLLSNQAGCLFNEAGSNTILGPIFMPFGGGSPVITVKSGFLTFAGPTISSDGIANARVLTLGGVGGLIASAFVDTNSQTASAQVNSGTWTFTGASTTTGTLTAGGGTMVFNGSWAGGQANVNSGGTLSGNGVASNLTVNAGGNFVPGGYGAIGNFTISNLLTISGAVYASLNKSLTPSNTLVTVDTTGATNIVANSGSSLVVSNLGPALQAGDRFQIFNQGVTNGNVMTIVPSALPGGLGWTNNLAVDGSISVVSTVFAPTNSPTITGVSISGGNLVISATNGDTGALYYLLDSTNVTTPVAQWKTIATNVASGNSFTFTATNGVTAGTPQQFYILSSTNYNP